MSQRYQPADKAEILKTLAANGGDVPVTSLHTGVPERTLRTWRRQSSLQPPNENPRQRRQLPPELTPSAAKTAAHQARRAESKRRF